MTKTRSYDQSLVEIGHVSIGPYPSLFRIRVADQRSHTHVMGSVICMVTSEQVGTQERVWVLEGTLA